MKTEEDDGPQRGGLCESTRGTVRLQSEPEKATDTVPEDGKAIQKETPVHIRSLNPSQTHQEKDPKKVCGLLLLAFFASI